MFGKGIDLKKELPKIQQKQLPVCNSDDLFTLKSSKKEAVNEIFNILKTCDDYLSDFLPERTKCVACDATLGGILGSFVYGLVHGEGYCSNCHYPARANHYIKDESGKEIMQLNIILQYHPSKLSYDR